MSKHEDDPFEYTKNGAKYGGGIGALLGAGHAMHTMPSGVPHGMDPKSALAKYILTKGAQGLGGAIGGGVGGGVQAGGLGLLLDLVKGVNK